MSRGPAPGLMLKGSILKLFEAIAASMVAFILLFYAPTVLPSRISGFVTVTAGALGSQLLSKLIQPTAPTLGLFIVVLVFAGVLSRGSGAYGLMVVLNGLAFLLYVYSLFQGGVVQVEATGDAFGSTQATLDLTISVTLMMLVFMIPPALTVVKGMLLMRKSPEQKA